jgi:alpha-beta hydrolase superfamily lysophospholipase
VPGREPDPVFVLIHSPLVGPMTWSRVADELGRRGRETVVPSLLAVADAEAPQWRRVPEAVRAATARIPNPIILVGHSGGGLLLPAITGALVAEVAGVIFVDSFLPPATGTVPLATPALMDRLGALATDGVLPPWSNWFAKDAMQGLVPDDRLRTALEDEMPRLPLSYFDASVPLPDGWDALPCAYLLFAGEPYGESAADARRRGWPVAEISGTQHLALVTDPIAVTDALLNLEHALVESV